MASTSVQSNTKAVAFRGRAEREMARLPKPETVSKPAGVKKPKDPMAAMKRAAKRGLVSEKAMKKHMGEGT